MRRCANSVNASTPYLCPMLCYKIPYQHKFGSFVASKWAQTPEEALSLVKKAQAGMSASTGIITYGPVVPVCPQPFESKATTAGAGELIGLRAA